MENNDIDNLIKSLSKEFEDKIIQPLADIKPIEVIPFGIKSLDDLTGVGGIPRGRVTEIFGSESSGKSSLCLSAVAEAQKLGLKCAYVDMEFSMTKELATKIGVDIARLIYVQPETGEEALKAVDEMIKGGVKMIVVDSVSSLVPEDELEAEFDEQSMALQARLMSKAMRKLLGVTKKENVALVFINQLRDDIGKPGFGIKTTTSGGRALRFYSSLRLKAARKNWLPHNKGKDETATGMTIIITSEKNKMSQPQLNTEIEFYFATGFDKGMDLLNHMIRTGEVTTIGRTHYLGDIELGNKEAAIKYLNEKLSTA